jgi:hypothetical protein
MKVAPITWSMAELDDAGKNPTIKASKQKVNIMS